MTLNQEEIENFHKNKHAHSSTPLSELPKCPGCGRVASPKADHTMTEREYEAGWVCQESHHFASPVRGEE